MAKLKERLITDAEWMNIRVTRLEMELGYRVHNSHYQKEGDRKRFYFWSMGAQPGFKTESLISATTPEAAAKKFLRHFLIKREERSFRNFDDCVPPVSISSHMLLLSRPKPDGKTRIIVTKHRIR